MAAPAGGQKGDQAVARQTNFLAGVEVEVVGVDLHPARRTAAGRFDQRVGRDQVVVDRVPQMRQIQSTERSVPVRAVALAAIEFGSCLRNEVRPLDGLFFAGDLPQSLADLQHAGVHLVRFGILDAKVPPGAAANVGPQSLPLGIVLFTFGDLLEFDQPLDGERHSVISR